MDHYARMDNCRSRLKFQECLMDECQLRSFQQVDPKDFSMMLVLLLTSLNVFTQLHLLQKGVRRMLEALPYDLSTVFVLQNKVPRI